MRILFVSPWLPYPDIPHAGGQSLYHIMRSLAEREHQLHLICYGRQEPQECIDAPAQLCASVNVVIPAYSWKQKLEHFVRDGWYRPWRLGQRTHDQVRELIRNICAQQDIDIIHYVWTEMGRYLPDAPAQVGTVLGTQDVEYLVRPREVSLYPWGVDKLKAMRRANALVKGERDYVRRANIVLASSLADRMNLATFSNPHDIKVFYPWIDIDTMRTIGTDVIVPGRLTYMGALDRMANARAVRFLADEVWPLIRTDHLTATLRIVGANPPPWLLHRAEGDSRLTVTGFVPDITPEWGATDVAVSPSLIGGGLLVKVAQPMAAGRPVVTTTLGNEGIGAGTDAIEIAEDASSFAGSALRLLANRQSWESVSRAGRRHVLDRLDWCANIDGLEEAYLVAVEKAGA